MSSLNNRVHLIGHAGGDPEILNLESGKRLARFSMATSEFFKTKKGDWAQDTQWHRIIAWDKKVELVENLVRKGQHIEIKGRINYHSYKALDGSTRYLTQIICLDLGIPNQKERPEPSPQQQTSPVEHEHQI